MKDIYNRVNDHQVANEEYNEPSWIEITPEAYYILKGKSKADRTIQRGEEYESFWYKFGMTIKSEVKSSTEYRFFLMNINE